MDKLLREQGGPGVTLALMITLPAWAKYLAQNGDGQWLCFSHRPEAYAEGHTWICQEGVYDEIGRGTPPADFLQTLRTVEDVAAARTCWASVREGLRPAEVALHWTTRRPTDEEMAERHGGLADGERVRALGPLTVPAANEPEEVVPGPRVSAEVHSDDRVFEAEFNAAAYLAQVGDDTIRDLAADGWGGGYASDYVAMFMADRNPRVAAVFEYLERFNHDRIKDGIGYECHVNEEEALAWLKANRRPLYDELTAAREGEGAAVVEEAA